MSDQEDVTWTCRFHPTDWWHEVGCPHMEWTAEQLRGALIEKNRFEQGKIESVITQQVAHDAEVAARAKREQYEPRCLGAQRLGVCWDVQDGEAMSEQLKPCDCGNETMELLESFVDDVHGVRCPKCGAETDEYPTQAEAIAAWNRRADGKQ